MDCNARLFLFQKNEKLQQRIRNKTSKIARSCLDYLRSEGGKSDILRRTQPITTISALKKEIAILLIIVVGRWLTGVHMKSFTETVDREIRKYTQELDTILEKIEYEMFDGNLPYYTGLQEYDVDISSVFMALLPQTVSLTLMELIPVPPEISLHEFLKERVYEFIINGIGETDLEECLEMSITRKYIRILNQITNAYKQKLKYIRQTVYTLCKEKTTVQSHVSSCRKLMDKINRFRQNTRPLCMYMRKLDLV